MDLKAALLKLSVQPAKFDAGLLDESHRLGEVAHVSAADVAANCTLHVNDGVVPAIVHTTR